MKKFNYENKEYLQKLNELDSAFYSKYIRTIKNLVSKDKKILDVGCGSGVVLKTLKKSGHKNLYGVDISSLFVVNAKRKGLANIKKYNGVKLPFENNFFDIVGSFNVLEHTQEPERYLVGQIEKTKIGGYIIVACPNFLTAIFNSPHPRIKGVSNKIKNIGRVISKFTMRSGKFERMSPIIRKKFQYDDDAIVVTNLLDLRKVLEENGCKIYYMSGFINMDNLISRFLDRIPLIIYLLPSCFVVAKKV